jgi:sporulation protein YlmC with PRC-barrel domain
MKFAKDLLNKQIVSVDNGQILGKVHDVYLDADLRTVSGLHLGHEGFLRRTAQLIPRSEIMLLGRDTVLVKQADVVVEEEQIEAVEQWVRRENLAGRELATAGGTKIATIDDVVIDDTGEVLGFTLGRTYVDSPVAESGAVSRAVIIDVAAADNVITMDLEKAEQELFRVN